jgi:hypothetical protein
MISLNSLAAFTQEVTRGAGLQPARGPMPEPVLAAAAPTAPQRPLGAVPPAPAQPLPRGSLLDLRV